MTEHQRVSINAKPLALHQQTRVGSDASRQSIDAGIVEDAYQPTIVPAGLLWI
jgi:hypothetical protein